MAHLRTTYTALLVLAVAIFGLAAGAEAADRRIRVKVPGIT